MLLDRLLTELDVRIDAFLVCEVNRGWRLLLDANAAASAHYGLMGSGVMRVPNAPPIPLPQHSFVVLPPRFPHSIEVPNGRLRETSGRPQPSLLPGARTPLIRAGDGGEGVITACGIIRATYGGTLGLFDHLKEPIVERFEEPESLHDTFRTLLAEVAEPKVGTRALTEALLKQCLVLLLRRRLAKDGPAALSWLAALADPRLASAVEAMLERPAHPFTVDELAGVAGMSRSAFADRFVAAFRQPPVDFLRTVRLRRAARLLRTTDLPVKVVASSVGYTSRSYFSRAFRSLYGTDPTSFRARTSE